MVKSIYFPRFAQIFKHNILLYRYIILYKQVCYVYFVDYNFNYYLKKNPSINQRI